MAAVTVPQTARLGPHTVNRVGFGAMQLAGPGVFGPPADPAAARAVLRRAIELGVDHIDTAQFYGPDVVNELIRDALHPYPAGLRIVSKVGARRDSRGGVLPASHPDELRAGVEANLQTLRVDALALVNLRLMGPDARGGVPLAEQLGALKTLQDEGKIESIGLSNASVDEVASALEIVDLGEVQNAYNIKLPRRRGRLALLRRSRHRLRARSSRSGRPSRLTEAACRTRRSPPSLRSTPRRPPRSPWRGCCTRIGTFC